MWWFIIISRTQSKTLISFIRFRKRKFANRKIKCSNKLPNFTKITKNLSYEKITIRIKKTRRKINTRRRKTIKKQKINF